MNTNTLKGIQWAFKNQQVGYFGHVGGKDAYGIYFPGIMTSGNFEKISQCNLELKYVQVAIDEKNIIAVVTERNPTQ